MKNFDSFPGHEAPRHFAPELTGVRPLWNHPKIVLFASECTGSLPKQGVSAKPFFLSSLSRAHFLGPHF
jgi:hypothetical protein